MRPDSLEEIIILPLHDNLDIKEEDYCLLEGVRSFWSHICGIKPPIYLMSSHVSWRSWWQSPQWRERKKSQQMNHPILKSVSKIAGINHTLEVPVSLHWLERGFHVRHHSEQPFVATAQSPSRHYQNTHLQQQVEDFSVARETVGFLSQPILKEGWMATLLQEVLQGSSWVKEFLIKQFSCNPMAKDALSSSFYGYNLHFPSCSPQAFLSRQAVWCSHHPQAQRQHRLSAWGKWEKCQPQESLHRWAEMLMEEKQEDYKKYSIHTACTCCLFQAYRERVVVNQRIYSGIPVTSGEQTPLSSKAVGKFQQE